MRIGFEAKRIFHNQSGLGNFGRNLVRSLATYLPENQYLLFNSHPGKIDFGKKLSPVEEIRPRITNVFYRDLWRQSLVTKDIKRQQVDVYHGLSMELPKGIKQIGVPSILSVHDLIFLRYPELYKRIDRNIYLAKLKRSLKEASLIVATSLQTKQDLIELMNIDPNQIKTHYQGVHPYYWEKYSPEQITATKQRFNLPERYALFVGTLEERKGVHRLLEAQLETGIDLVYIGRPTPFWEQALAEDRFKTIRNKVYTPVVAETKDLSQIYQGAEFFTYPSIFEGFGIPVLEALVSSTPVITSNSSSLPEVAGPGSLLVDPEDTNALAQAMASLWNSEAKRKDCVQNSLTFIEQFRDQNLVVQWEQTYRSLLK